MGDLTAESLLGGPRGRLLCLTVAGRLHEQVRSAWTAASWSGRDPAQITELVAAVQEVDVTQVLGWRDPSVFVEPVADSVVEAMYWQPPDERDALTADASVSAALEPVADAIAASPAAAWWTSPVDLHALRYTGWVDADAVRPSLLSGAADRLVRWRDHTVAATRRAGRERPRELTASVSGRWWSTPAMSDIVTTTRPLPRLGSAELVWEEDFADRRAADIQVLRVRAAPRVYEIDCPAAWTALVDRYPMDVTDLHRHDWYRTTGLGGRWLIPDWAAVGLDWDAVHLTVAGYLGTATRAWPLAQRGLRTMLAGWNPDQTWWLTDILEAPASPPERWTRPRSSRSGEDDWAPAAVDHR